MKHFWIVPFKSIFKYFKPTTSPLSNEEMFMAQQFIRCYLN